MEMKKAITYTLNAGRKKFTLKKGYFQFMTFDFMITKDLQVFD